MLRHLPWDGVFLAGFVVYVWTRGVFEKRTKHNKRDTQFRFPGDTALLSFVFVGTVGLPLLYLAAPVFSFADYHLPVWEPWMGVAVMLFALWLFWRSHVDLGLNWSMHLEVRRGHELVTKGVYARVRHPMYAAIWAFSLAQGLLLSNWLAGWSAVACFAPIYFVRTPKEERFMREVFGPAYDAYRQRTGRLFPPLLKEGL